jgi:hypothetical protein
MISVFCDLRYTHMRRCCKIGEPESTWQRGELGCCLGAAGTLKQRLRACANETSRLYSCIVRRLVLWLNWRALNVWTRNASASS